MRYIVLTLFLGFCGFLFARNDLGKQRLIVTTDLGGADPDRTSDITEVIDCYADAYPF